MKLYTAAGACGLHVQIVVREAGLPFDLDLVDLDRKVTADGTALPAITSKGYIPAAVLPTGETLTEGAVISRWIAEQASDAGLIPPPGSFDRLRAPEWIHFIGTEIHKAFCPFFEATTDAEKAAALRAVAKRLPIIEQRLSDHDWMVGDRVTLVDAYLFNVMTWARPVRLDLAPYPSIVAHLKRMQARPSVRASLAAAGLLKTAA